MESGSKQVYDCVVVGAGMSGLSCAHALVTNHGIDASKIILLEAQDYVGGRIKQDAGKFIKGVEIELGAEILHGPTTSVANLAKSLGEKGKSEEFFCWCQGDGGPSKKVTNGGYCLYFIKGNKNDGTNDGTGCAVPSSRDVAQRILRFDAKDEDYVHANEVVECICDEEVNEIGDKESFLEYMKGEGISEDMIRLLDAGYANTVCSSSETLSMKKLVEWEKVWENECEEDGEARFDRSYACILEHLQQNLTIHVNTPVQQIKYSSLQSKPTEILCKNGTKIYSKAVVVSCSANVLRNAKLLAFSPPLPRYKLKALESSEMRVAMKVILKFTQPCWPPNLHGVIVAGYPIPEIWFRDVSDKTKHFPEEKATCYCTGFLTANYADSLISLLHTPKIGQNEIRWKEELCNIFLSQLTEMFGDLKPEHCVPSVTDDQSLNQGKSILKNLPKPRNVFLDGLVHTWTPATFPYISGGYSSPKLGCDMDYQIKLAQSVDNKLFFCGEATSLTACTTAHSAFDSGVRAANEVSAALKLQASMQPSVAMFQNVRQRSNI